MQNLDGLLFFPVTPFSRSGDVALDILRQHLETGLAAGPGGLFVACGTGEFHSLSLAEYEPIVRTAVEVSGGEVPVFSGVGGAIATAIEMARVAERAGADGLLILPPYLVTPTPAGLVEYARRIAEATTLPLIVYNRDNAIFDRQAAVDVAALPTVMGFKDGQGDVGLLGRIVPAVAHSLAGTGKTFQFFNGLPTAEVSALAYRGLGITLYSSAIWCFAPQISKAFHRAVSAGDQAAVDSLITGFFNPFVDLRNQIRGGAISLVKAAVCLGGLDVGGVRPPLADPTPQQREQLAEIVATGLRLAAATQAQPTSQLPGSSRSRTFI
ncbi:5-dehydro-4-deoxyglucarate dehydratase [Dactylosporangium sp. NPDC050688]|uniref:5-dehydro-4-deoxyglucarate dehydratase n=1 Tax=Dactylosporangium sp. NPDC050688 TaxID=3157217 RepID=UPI00340F7B89